MNIGTFHMMRVRSVVWNILPVAGLLAGLLFVAAACGGTGTEVSAANTEGSDHEAGPVTVNVEAGDLYIHASQTTFKVGVPYHFVLTNAGRMAHEVMLMPVVENSSGMDMKEMDKMALGMVEKEEFPAGATGAFDVTFNKPYSPGELELACHIPGHYEGGMHTSVTVVSQ